MKIIESEITAAIIARLKEFLPAEFAASVIEYPDRPEELTEDVMKDSHPKGLFMVDFVESVADGAEIMTFGVFTLTIGRLQREKLTRAAKLIVNGLRPFGADQLLFHEDKPVMEEGGIFLRCVSFQIPTQTLPKSDGKIAAKIAELEL